MLNRQSQSPQTAGNGGPNTVGSKKYGNVSSPGLNNSGMQGASGYGFKQKAASPNNYASSGQNQTYQASANSSSLGGANGHKKQLFSSRDSKQMTPGGGGPVSQSGSNSRAAFGQTQKYGGTGSRAGAG